MIKEKNNISASLSHMLYIFYSWNQYEKLSRRDDFGDFFSNKKFLNQKHIQRPKCQYQGKTGFLGNQNANIYSFRAKIITVNVLA